MPHHITSQHTTWWKISYGIFKRGVNVWKMYTGVIVTYILFKYFFTTDYNFIDVLSISKHQFTPTLYKSKEAFFFSPKPFNTFYFSWYFAELLFKLGEVPQTLWQSIPCPIKWATVEISSGKESAMHALKSRTIIIRNKHCIQTHYHWSTKTCTNNSSSKTVDILVCNYYNVRRALFQCMCSIWISRGHNMSCSFNLL